MSNGASSWEEIKTRRARAATRAAWAWTFTVAWCFGLALTAVLRLSLTSTSELPSPPDAPAHDPESSIAAGIRYLAQEANNGDARILWSFYERRNFAPFWTSPEGLTLDGLALVKRIEKREMSGPRLSATLVPSASAELGHPIDFGFADDASAGIDRVSRLEWALSRSFLGIARGLLQGRVSPTTAQRGWHHEPERNRGSFEADAGSTLADAVDRGVGVVLAELDRAHEDETALFLALQKYRAIQRAGGWQPIPIEEWKDPSDVVARSRVVRSLRARLHASGDLETPGVSDIFDDELDWALRRFQSRHGLEDDGKLGAKTLAALNVSVDERIEQILVNLERRRWLPRRFDGDYIWVNVPEFRLRAYRDGGLAREMNVVVGKPSTKTPLFSEKLAYVVFNPYWYVPPSIAQNELLPRHRNDSTYLSSRGFEVVDRNHEIVSTAELSASGIRSGTVRIRRRPGASNDLGTIKFIMPNRHNVYLHDTSSRHLFSRSVRAFSHGCIRVEHPDGLATYVLDGQVSEPDVYRMFGSGSKKDRKVVLERSISVYVVYFTAFMRDGVVHFRNDIYGHDASLGRALSEEPDRVATPNRLVASAS
jgi:murein L,D-transpeptidase YcbB/YkuD